MADSPEDLFSYHVDNLRRVEDAITQVSRKVKLAIKQEDEAGLKTFKPLYILLCGVWSETRFKKLIYESPVTEKFREDVLSERTQLRKWHRLVEKSFRSHYSIDSSKPLSKQSLPFSAFARYDEIGDIIDDRLKPIIELRNNLAHGEWEYPLTSDGKSVSSEKCRLLKNEDYLSYHFRLKILRHLSDLIHDLVVSKPTFKRDFDENHDKLINAVKHMNEMDYEEWSETLREKYRRGKKKRRQNIKS